MTGFLYQTLEGIFGTAVDVSSSLIILFTIYGAFLQQSGAGKFFLDWSFAAMGGRRTGAGRTVVLASFLLGGPSGSGVATTVTIGSVAYPMLERAGYGKDAAGGLLAAGGLGAIISPPVLGAAAFLIAEFLKISYLDVLLMATIPTLLYYLSLFLMVELDARKFGMRDVTTETALSLGELTRRYWYHFGSLVSIVVFMVLGFSPILSVFYATVVTYLASFIRRDTMMGVEASSCSALKDGSGQMLNVAATCAAAGIIVGVVAKTGLGLKFSAIVIAYAGGSLPLTALYTALIVWVIGLAVPVTASYIICAVIAAPALMKLGVPDYAAHMFIFYYAVLSEVSPPTALSPFAAAAITGGNPYRTTLQSWKYTLPAFVVPFVFVLDPAGIALLLKVPPAGVVAARRVDRLHRDRRHRRIGGGRAEVAVARVLGGRAVDPGRVPGSFSSIPRRRPIGLGWRSWSDCSSGSAGWVRRWRYRGRSKAEGLPTRNEEDRRALRALRRIASQSGQQGDPLGVRAAHHVERDRAPVVVDAGRRVRIDCIVGRVLRIPVAGDRHRHARRQRGARLSADAAGLARARRGGDRVRRGVDRAVHRAQDRRQEAVVLRGHQVPADRPGVAPRPRVPPPGYRVLARDAGPRERGPVAITSLRTARSRPCMPARCLRTPRPQARTQP